MENVIALRSEEPPRKESKAANRQAVVLTMMSANQGKGMTWREVASATGLGHGTVSGILSNLHAAGKLARLRETRDRLRVYVTPEWVLERQTESPKKTRQNALLDDMAAVLTKVPTKCEHRFWEQGCRSCEVRRVLHLYDNRQY